jgi:hypothetical protein
MAEHWIQKATAHSHGQFAKAADKAGMSTAAYANKEANDPHASAKKQKQANLAKVLMSMRHGKR